MHRGSKWDIKICTEGHDRYISKYPMLTRNKCKYVVNRSQTERYKRSAIPDMQRKLNQSLIEQR